uniref:Uncharacterized protein n=1 Tax=Aegilops tauschii subsp. strangulata TaxID=200361 RepID=A0A453DJX1_AEGTS
MLYTPKGCDTSLLLCDKFWSKLNMPQNNGIRRNSVYLIEGILGEDGPGTIYSRSIHLRGLISSL